MKKLIFVFTSFFFIQQTSAIVMAPDLLDLSRYQKQIEFQVQGITTPKVVRMQSSVPLEGFGTLFKKNDYGTITATKGSVLPSRVVRSYEKRTQLPNVEITSVSSMFDGVGRDMVDRNPATGLMFDSLDTVHEIEITFPEVTEINSIRFTHGEGDIMAKRVSVQALFPNGEWRYIMRSETYKPYMTWPQIDVKALRFEFETLHLFRINEIYFSGTEETEMIDELIFFAEEGQEYIYFFDPAFGQSHFVSQTSLPLRTDEVTPVFTLPEPKQSGFYNDDYDGDGIIDREDLCPRDSDPQNTDRDNNGRGDVCEDPDQDSVYSSKDNCPMVHNPLQKDSDQDGVGDICDPDDSRMTENMDGLLYGVFGLAILLLGVLVWRSMKSK